MRLSEILKPQCLYQGSHNSWTNRSLYDHMQGNIFLHCLIPCSVTFLLTNWSYVVNIFVHHSAIVEKKLGASIEVIFLKVFILQNSTLHVSAWKIAAVPSLSGPELECKLILKNFINFSLRSIFSFMLCFKKVVIQIQFWSCYSDKTSSWK